MSVPHQTGSKAIQANALELVYQHARECYPSECCGFIRQSGAVHIAENTQDFMHAQDPISNPRTSAEAYTFSVRDLLTLERSFSTADPATVIYHSHPDVGAYFSKKDIEDALYKGLQKYDVDHLVIDVRKEGTKGARLFRFANVSGLR